MKAPRKFQVFDGGRDKPANARARGEGPRERDELLRLAIQVGGIGIYQTDFERDRTRFSPELCGILGLPVGTEMTFAQASRLFDERDQAQVEAGMEAAYRSADRGKWSGVHRVRRSDGAVRWVSIHGRRIYRDTPDGPKPVRSIGTVIDITHLKETEDALHEKERHLRLALDAAQMGTFQADLTGSQVIIDAQEARLLGLPEETRVVSAEELRKRVPFEDLEASDAKQKRLTEGGEPYQHEFRFLMPDGSERWLSAYSDIRSNRIFGVNFDVTERKRAEAALRESEARLRIATSGAALGVFEWDAKADHAVWENERIYEIFGRTLAEGPLSKQAFVAKYLHPGDAPDFEASLEEAMQTGGHFHAMCRMNRQDGTHRWLQIDGKFGVTGNPSRLLGVVSDITARKKLERRADKVSERLARAQERERRKIAQELHDSTVQHLVAADLTLMNLRSATALQREQQPLWDTVEASLREAMKELRTFSYLMHPPVLRAQRLRSSLGQYIDGFASRTGLDIRLRPSPQIDKLPARMQRSLYRIVQEALANVYRHASASKVSIQFRWIGDRLHMVITDNGRSLKDGLEHRRRRMHSGVGMRGIRARLNEFAGELRIIRIKPNGTRLHAAIPVCELARKAWAGDATEQRQPEHRRLKARQRRELLTTVARRR
jgi:PAS domain S-box-containing protein